MMGWGIGRREVIVGVGITVIGGAGLAAVGPGRRERLFASGYRAEGATGVRELDGDAGRWREGAAVADAANASWIEHHPRLPLAYVVDEQRQGTVSAFRLGDRRWQRLSTVTTQGADPCHLAVSRDGTMMAAANYSSGSVALYRLEPASGMPQPSGPAIAHRGRGPVVERQAEPHAHWVGFSPGGDWLHAVDLGADAVFAHRLDRAGRFTGETVTAHRAPPGSGPRHLARHPSRPVAYLVNELANTITVLGTRHEPALTAIATVSTLPDGVRGASQAGAIVVNADGTRLYASNRGHDSIAVFAIDGDGTLAPLQHVPSGGRWPRHMRLAQRGRVLLVANQHGGTVAVLPVRADGRLAPAVASVASPGVAFVDAWAAT